LMKDRRRVLAGKVKRGGQIEANKAERKPAIEKEEDELPALTSANQADEKDILDVFDVAGPAKKQKQSFRDPNFYMDYRQKDAHTEKGYSLNNSDSFTQQANRATFTLADDEAKLGTKSQAPNTTRWDVKKKKFVQGDGTGSDNKKLIKTESGRKLPASFKSGRYDEWQKEQRLSTQKVGEKEDSNVVRTARGLFERSRGGRGGSRGGRGAGGRAFVHTQSKPGKRPDKYEDNYKIKLAKYKEKNDEASSSRGRSGPPARGRGRGRGGAASGGRKTGSKARSELKDARQIQKDRSLANKRKEKNARPSRKGGKGRR
jgi:ATP-dependent RNA helicase DDX54/DBP10